MQETLNAIIPVFLIFFTVALANILYFKYGMPDTKQNQAIIGFSYAVLCLTIATCAITVGTLIRFKQTTSLVLLSACIPAYLSWDYLKSSRAIRRS